MSRQMTGNTLVFRNTHRVFTARQNF